jgi:hypothetical protein
MEIPKLGGYGPYILLTEVLEVRGLDVVKLETGNGGWTDTRLLPGQNFYFGITRKSPQDMALIYHIHTKR